MTPIDNVLDRLVSVKKSNNGYVAQCPGPGHADENPSLSITEGVDGQVLLHCYAGCETEKILAAVGLSWADLFLQNGAGGGHHLFPNSVEHSNTQGLTLAQYAAEKKLSIDFLKTCGLSEISYMGKPTVRIEYRGSNGELIAVRFRVAMAGDRFRWRRGDKAYLYGVPRLPEAKARGYITLCEGESDPQTLWYHKEPCAAFPGAGTFQEEWTDLLDGIPIVYIVIEPDKGGETVRRWLAESKIRDRAWLLNLGEYKDPSALHLADPSRFLERWKAVLAAAVPFTETEQAERNHAAQEAYTLAKDLLHDPKLLDHIGQVMRRRGYAGDLKPPKLTYVGMTSRLLERPQNLVVVSQSSAGKNRTVDAPAELMPPEALYLVKAGSARALIYTDEDFQHRMVIVAEADSIPEDGPAASAVRSLAADNYMAYDVVEINLKTKKWETRHIVKPGPTGLITTSTRSLPTQMNTRVLEIPIADSEEQTRAVMKMHARRVKPGHHAQVDLAPYIALQRWLALTGIRQVCVPYADQLSDLVPAKAVRMRRDFVQLLTCIQAIALLYQCQRKKTPEGWIAATIEDYAQARTLLAPIFDMILSEGVTPAVRQTVEAVKVTEEVTEAELVQRLKLVKSTVSYRVTRALKGGWLVNTEHRKGYPAKLSRGIPLPEVVSALPDPDKVQEAFERSKCSNAGESALEPFEHGESPTNSDTYKEPFDSSSQNRERSNTPTPPCGERPCKT